VDKLADVNSPKTLRALFALPGFNVLARLEGVFGDRFARVVVLHRRKKVASALAVVVVVAAATTGAPSASVTSASLTGASTWSSSVGASGALDVVACS
jgi:hypothetical protein